MNFKEFCENKRRKELDAKSVGAIKFAKTTVFSENRKRFLASCESYLYRNGKLTDAQIDALYNGVDGYEYERDGAGYYSGDEWWKY